MDEANIRRGSAWSGHPIDRIFETARLNPDAIAIVSFNEGGVEEGDVSITYGRLADRIRGTARLLRSLMDAPGESIVVVADATVEGCIALHAAQVAGALVAFDCDAGDGLASYIDAVVALAGARIAVVAGGGRARATRIEIARRMRLAGVEHVLHIDGAPLGGASRPLDPTAFPEAAGPDLDERIPVAGDYFGGLEKGVGREFASRAMQSLLVDFAANGFGFRHGDVVLTIPPLTSLYGAVLCSLTVLGSGATLLFADQRGDLEEAWHAAFCKVFGLAGATRDTSLVDVARATGTRVVRQGLANDAASMRGFLETFGGDLRLASGLREASVTVFHVPRGVASPWRRYLWPYIPWLPALGAAAPPGERRGAGEGADHVT